jgi:alkaline phosphatase
MKSSFFHYFSSRIDMAAHANDPAAHIYDVLAYQEAIQVVQQYVDTHPGTVLLSVSDHETGATFMK